MFIKLCLVVYAYSVLATRSVLLADQQGVLLYRGIFTWSRDVKGVEGRDIEDAVYSSGFVSWVFNSRPMQTRDPAVPSQIPGKREAVVHINESHRRALAGIPSSGVA